MVEYIRELRFTDETPKMYRVRLYAGDSDAGTLDSIVRTSTDAGTGFAFDTRPFVQLKEVSRT